MDEKQTGKVMGKKTPYFVANVTPFRDTRLSWKAKGLMTYFIDKPQGWVFRLEHIIKQAPDGKKAVSSGLKELKEYGYLVRVAYREGNKVAEYGFLVYPEPVAFPTTKDVHVNKKLWEEHLANDGDEDITLFVHKLKKEKKQVSQKGKPDKNLDNTQIPQKGEPEETLDNTQVSQKGGTSKGWNLEKVEPQKAGSSKPGSILITNNLPITNDLLNTNNKTNNEVDPVVVDIQNLIQSLFKQELTENEIQTLIKDADNDIEKLKKDIITAFQYKPNPDSLMALLRYVVNHWDYSITKKKEEKIPQVIQQELEKKEEKSSSPKVPEVDPEAKARIMDQLSKMRERLANRKKGEVQ